MGKYCVRFAGKAIKGAFKPFSKKVESEDEEPEEEEAEEMPGKEKMKITTPEKEVVAAVLGLPPKKKAKKEVGIGEKGGAKSGNYGHSGRPGKLGGSMPKRGGPTDTAWQQRGAYGSASQLSRKPTGTGAVSSSFKKGSTVDVHSGGLIERAKIINLSGDQATVRYEDGTENKVGISTLKAPASDYGAGKFHGSKLAAKPAAANKPATPSSTNARDVRVAEAKDKLLNTYKKVPGATISVPKRGHSILFDGIGYTYLKMAGGDDKHIEAALAKVETALGKKLPRDTKTDFPTFTIFRNGEEIGGG